MAAVHVIPSNPKLSEKVSCTDNTCSSPDSMSFSRYSLVALDRTPASGIIDIEFPCTEENGTGSQRAEQINMEHCNEKDMLNSPSKSVSQCRYCYKDICRKSSVSQCHCNGNLCKECLIREVVLTHNRINSEIQCTVCNKIYEVATSFEFECRRDCRIFFKHHIVFCGLKNEQYLLDSFGGKVGYALVILGIAVWILSTSLLFAFPPNGLPLYLYYMIAAFDLIVGTSTLWFLIKCRFLTSFFLATLYFLRCLYLSLGWMPGISLLNINMYQKAHINIMSYFISFSFIAFIILDALCIIDLIQQISTYKMRYQSLTINGIRIDMNNVNGYSQNVENDDFS